MADDIDSRIAEINRAMLSPDIPAHEKRRLCMESISLSNQKILAGMSNDARRLL